MSKCFGSNHYFSLFSLPVAFMIDKTQLKQQLLALQKQHHPDNTLAQQSTISSDLINHAFFTLINDDLRAIYLLELAGIAVNVDASISDIDFLDLMMDSRIILEESHDNQAIDDIHQKLNTLTETLVHKFDNAYHNKDWATAIQIALKLKFLTKLKDDTQKITPTTSLDDDLYV